MQIKNIMKTKFWKENNCKTNIKKKKNKRRNKKTKYRFFFSIYFAGKLCLGTCTVTAQ